VICSSILIFSIGATTAMAQTANVDALRREIEALRNTYESQISALEKRLMELESKTEKAQMAAQQATDALDEVFDPEFIEKGLPGNVTKNFEFHGYMRAGYGINEEGGGQEAFQAPGARAKYRLGNEKDTYGELIPVYKIPSKDGGAEFKFEALLGFQQGGDKNNFLTQNSPGVNHFWREWFVEASNVLYNRPEMSFWAGQRFYDRHDIHMNDFYYLDMSGFGGGFQNLDLGWSKLAVAWLGGTKDEFIVQDTGSLTENHLDIRFHEIETPGIGGKGMLWVDVARLGGGAPADSEFPAEFFPDSNTGVAVGWIHNHTLDKGYNKFSAQYGDGVASDFNTFITEPQDGTPGTATEDSKRITLTNQTVWQFSDTTSMMGALVLENADQGFAIEGSNDDERWWFSAGVRPIHMLTKHLAIQGELGVDYVDAVTFTPEDDDGWLGKITIAPTIRPNGVFFSRPELRLFASYFFWDENLPVTFGGEGVGPDDTSGWSFGIQSEMWW
jgi:maltoporin